MLIITAVFFGEMLSDLAFQIAQLMKKGWINEMLRVLVYSGVLKLKNVNKKGLCWQAKLARHRFSHGKALSCCFCRYAKNISMLEYAPDSKSIQFLTNSSLLFIPSGCEVFKWYCHYPSFRFLALVSPLEISIPMIEMFSNAQLP